MKVLVDYDRFLENREDHSLLSGSQGFCYIKDGFIYKFYNYPKIESELVDLSKYRSSKIAFPICYFYDKKDESKVVGEKMVYFPKKNISMAIFEDSDIDKLVKHYIDILAEIRKYPEIRMEDLVSPNILYDEETGFSIIDTSEWSIVENYDFFEINKHRIEFELTDVLLDKLLGIFHSTLDNYNFRHNLLSFGSKGNELLESLELALDDEDRFFEIIELYHLIFDGMGYKPIKTIDDMKKYTKKLKKG